MATVVVDNQNKEYEEGRFEFALYVNDFLITKRNFKINKFIEGSMQTLDFKCVFDGLVNKIQEDLKSKSRVYTWYYFNEDDILDEFKKPLLKPWECTFRFEITDNKKLVMSRIWDGYSYPKAIREKVDLTNKLVKIVTKDGMTYTFDKSTYFEENKDRLSPEMYVLRAMIMDKQDLLTHIIKTICKNCSPREDMFQTIGNYTVSDVYKTRDFVRNADGSIKMNKNGEPIFTKSENEKKYFFSVNLTNNQVNYEWAKAVSDKTKEYFKTLR